MTRLMRKCLFGDPVEVFAIPVGEARLCVQCSNIIRERVCPKCTSKVQLFINDIIEPRMEKK